MTGAQAARLGKYYAACVQENIEGKIDALFGPAYKGIPLAVACSIALSSQYGRDINYCFNREGGGMVGYKLKSGDRVVIIEDVITAGTAMRECLPLLKATADIEIAGLIVSADRMERGQRELSAIQEIKAEYDIETYPIVTVREIIDALHNRPVKGKVVLNDEMREKMESYLTQYGIK